MPHAIVSGLGPNGMIAALTLLDAGWRVTAVEQRHGYGRAIHLSLRDSWFLAVRALDAALADAIAEIASPIEELQHIARDGARPPVRPTRRVLPPDAAVRERLAADPIQHVRLDALERCMFDHIGERGGDRLEVVHGAPFSIDPHSRAVTIGGRAAAAPDLIVIAEGGKSPTARALGKEPVKLSAPRFYISVHIQEAIGPVSRRLDTTVDAPEGAVPVSAWATGHRDRALGTWLVVEIPASVHADRSSKDVDRAHLDRAARALLGIDHGPTPTASPFTGTFRFEQQMLRDPTDGDRLVFFGDAAGMGHHALSTGLELGACDQRALRALIAGGPVAAYRTAVARARIDLLAHGMAEYYPLGGVDPTRFIEEALKLPDALARAHVERALGGDAGERS